MRPLQSARTVLLFGVLALSGVSRAQTAAGAESPPVTAPPESFLQLVRDRDRDVARKFYKKFIDVRGMPVVASGEVADLALQRTHSIVTHLLAGRPDVIQALVKRGMTCRSTETTPTRLTKMNACAASAAS